MRSDDHQRAIALPPRRSSVRSSSGLTTKPGTLDKVARLSILLLLVTTLVVPTSLAFASPPDPSWIQGIYDEGDFDNVVDLISSSAGVVDLFPTGYRRVVPLVIAVLPEMYERALPRKGSALIQPRAPPQI